MSQYITVNIFVKKKKIELFFTLKYTIFAHKA